MRRSRFEEINWRGPGYYAPRQTKAVQAEAEFVTWLWVEGETDDERSRDARSCGCGTPKRFEVIPPQIRQL